MTTASYQNLADDWSVSRVTGHFVDNRLRYKLRVTFKIKDTVLIITYAKDPRRIEDGDIPADF